MIIYLLAFFSSYTMLYSILPIVPLHWLYWGPTLVEHPPPPHTHTHSSIDIVTHDMAIAFLTYSLRLL